GRRRVYTQPFYVIYQCLPQGSRLALAKARAAIAAVNCICESRKLSRRRHALIIIPFRLHIVTHVCIREPTRTGPERREIYGCGVWLIALDNPQRFRAGMVIIYWRRVSKP